MPETRPIPDSPISPKPLFYGLSRDLAPPAPLESNLVCRMARKALKCLSYKGFAGAPARFFANGRVRTQGRGQSARDCERQCESGFGMAFHIAHYTIFAALCGAFLLAAFAATVKAFAPGSFPGPTHAT